MYYLTPRDVGAMLSLSPRTVRRYCASGIFKGSIYIGCRWRIPESAVAKLASDSELKTKEKKDD